MILTIVKIINQIYIQIEKRGEIWKDKEEEIKEDLEILRKEELTLGQSLELYNLLGGDQSKALEGIKLKNNEEEEKEDNNEKPKEDAEENKFVIKRKRIKF